MANESRLTIQTAVKKSTVTIPNYSWGSDTSVHLEEALMLHTWSPRVNLSRIGRCESCVWKQHPWLFEELPPYLQQIHQKSPILLTIRISS